MSDDPRPQTALTDRDPFAHAMKICLGEIEPPPCSEAQRYSPLGAWKAEKPKIVAAPPPPPKPKPLKKVVEPKPRKPSGPRKGDLSRSRTRGIQKLFQRKAKRAGIAEEEFNRVASERMGDAFSPSIYRALHHDGSYAVRKEWIGNARALYHDAFPLKYALPDTYMFDQLKSEMKRTRFGFRHLHDLFKEAGSGRGMCDAQTLYRCIKRDWKLPLDLVQDTLAVLKDAPTYMKKYKPTIDKTPSEKEPT
jgi:hypothetical protein